VTFLEIVNAAMSDRFDEVQRADIKNWVNSRYGRVWAQEDWSFKKISASVSVPLGTSTVSVPTLQRVNAVYDSSFGYTPAEVYSTRPEDFVNTTYTSSGNPVGFTWLNGLLNLDKPVSSARSLYIIGEQKWTPLVNDADVPLLPAEFHFMLVHGASSEGLRLQNDPTWQGFEEDFQRMLVEMRNSYLTQVRTYGDAYPSWPY